MNFTIFYIPCKNKAEADKIGRFLLKSKLIACTNTFPINSSYWWKGKIVNSKETVLIAKTTNKRAGKVEKQVRKYHSYTCPAIVKWKANSNKDYEKWVGSAVK